MSMFKGHLLLQGVTFYSAYLEHLLILLRKVDTFELILNFLKIIIKS
jgi:hypothetical protein